MKEKKKIRWPVLAAVLVIPLAVLLYLIISPALDKTISVTLTEKEVLEQSKDKEYCIEGKNITYTFQTDGVLAISGTGSTIGFENVQEARNYFFKELYQLHTGSYPKEVEQAWALTTVLDRVTEIKVEEGISSLGDFSFSPFFYVEEVHLPETLVSAGSYVFLAMGQYAENEPVCYGLRKEQVSSMESSFVAMATGKEVLLAAADGTIIGTNAAPDQETELSDSTKNLRPAEERGTVPERELLLSMVTLGDNITGSLYENGVLYVSGYGATFDFVHFSEMERHIMEELHLISKTEAETLWFDKVVEIVIEDTVERIGNNALAQYKNACLVTGGALKEVGNRAFFSLGTDTVPDTEWNLDLKETKVEEDAFFRCKNKPVVATR